MSYKRDEEQEPQETQTNGQSKPVEGSDEMVRALVAMRQEREMVWVGSLSSPLWLEVDLKPAVWHRYIADSVIPN